MKQKTRSLRIAAFTLAFSVFVLSAQDARADAWGANAAAAIMKQTMENISRQIEGAILGALKASAIQLLNTQVANLIGGSTVEGSRVISDWRAFLYEEPENRVKLQMEDFYSQTTKGRASSSYDSQYSLANGTNPTLGSYSSYLVESSRVSLSKPYQPTTLEDIDPNPVQSLEEGDLRTLNALFASPTNNPIGYTLTAQSYEQSLWEQESQIAMVEAISGGGYKGVKNESGQTILPGSTVGQIVADAQDIGNKVIAGASNPAELASGIVVSLVNKTITGVIQKGVGEIESNIREAVNEVDQQVSAQVRAFDSALGSAAQYTKEVQQQTNVNVKPAADPGAAIPQGIRL